MKVLVTGGAGYIGSHTCVELLEAGHEVVVLDNLSNSCETAVQRVEQITGKSLPFYQTDLLDYAACEKVFQAHAFDAVIHFAGLKAVGESVARPLAYYHNNITGTLHLLDLMQKYRVKNLVFSSSATVYGNPHTVPIREDFPLSATNPYGRTKLMLEQILRDVAAADDGLRVSLLRYFNPVGAHKSGMIGEDPNDIPNNLMPYIAQVAIGKLPCLSVFGNDYDTPDGTGVRDYIHVIDLARGHLKALDHLEAQKERVDVFNLGTGHGYSVLEMVAAFEKASGKHVPYRIAPRRPGDIAACYADPSKAARELGFRAEYSLADMCADSWNWQSKNPNGYHG